MTINTRSVHFSADKKLLDFIDKKLSKLDHYFDRIVDAQIILRLENSGQIKDKIAEVKLFVPGGILFVKESSKTFETSVEQAVASLKRQLIKHKERRNSARMARNSNG